MEPLYDTSTNLVGWIDYDGDYGDADTIWDASMNWVAYVSDGNGWSVATGVGVVRWSGRLASIKLAASSLGAPTHDPEGGRRPMRPMRPMQPMRPQCAQ